MLFFILVFFLFLHFFFFFFNDTATTEIYTLSLHDALPISRACRWSRTATWSRSWCVRSEEHTSELQSHHDLVCRLLLEKKKKKNNNKNIKKKNKEIKSLNKLTNTT